MTDLLSKEHRIIEKGMMEFRPFGEELNGEKIRDVSGLTVVATVEFMAEAVSRSKGAKAGQQAVERLVQLMNERIPDAAYHVDEEFLRKLWNSYSYEFVMFLAVFCEELSGDPQFQRKLGEVKFISPIIKILGSPFSIKQIYQRFAYFGEKYARGSINFETVSVSNQSAVLRISYTERTYRQFGPYLKACAWQICEATKGAIAAMPKKVHNLATATVTDRSCVANGDQYCEWEVTWPRHDSTDFVWVIAGFLVAGLTYVYLRLMHPGLMVLEAFALALCPAFALWLGFSWQALRKDIKARGRILQEQLEAAEARHEELLEAYSNQEHTAVQLRRKVTEIEQLNANLETKVRERTAKLEELNIQLETANQRLQELDRLKSQFLSHCSHELRTPLSSIKGFSESLIQGVGGTLTDKQQTYLSRINANANRLTRMIADLLDLSRIEAGKLEFRCHDVMLPSLAEEVLEQLQPLAQVKEQRLEITCSDRNIIVLGDRDRLTQVLTNLIDNAIKFTPQGGSLACRLRWLEWTLA